VVPAGAVPIRLKSGGGVASGPQGASGRVDVASRSVTAAKAPASKKTELVALRNEHSRTFAQPDGTYSLEVSPGRMNYQDAGGTWQPVDLSLKPTGDPAFGLEVASLDRAVAIGTSTGSAGVARVSTSKGSVSLSATRLGPASVNASDVAFAAASKGDPSVTVAPTDTGFEFAGTWADAGTSPALELTLDPGALLPSLDADGRTVLLSSVDVTTNADGPTPVGLISAPMILEGGADGGPARDQSIVSVSLAPGTGTTWTLRYALDPAWLADPARVFPVVLDPSVCLGEGASGCTYNGTGVNADHFVESGLPNSYPTGWNVIRVGYDIRGWGYQKERALLYFESVGLSALPDGATIFDTDLKLHISSEYGSPTSETITAYRITEPWSLTTTWNQFGSGGNGYTSTNSVATAVPASGYMHWDPDAIVQSWYAHRAQGWTQNLGFALKMSTESSAKGDVEFDRYNDATAAYRPLLTINYEIPQAELSFDPALGSSYAPTTMLAGVPTTLPVRVKNTSGFTFTAYASNPNSYYDLAYRFFDQQGNVPAGGSGRTHLPASLANGATSATIPLAVTPPSAPGPYSLRLDLARYEYGTLAYASDYADPAKFYARAKTSAVSDNTRWTGGSVIERDEFSVRAVATTPQGGEWESVELGDGGTLAINLWSRDLEYTGDGGVGFSDLLLVGLAYGYRDSAAGDATGILGANGWWTNLDERLVGGSGAGDFTYQDPRGNRIPVNTNQDAQLLGAGIVLSRPRVTIWDENGQGPPGVTLGDPTNAAFASPAFAAFSGQYVLKVALDANHVITPTGFKAIDLNQYPMARFEVRTSAAASAGVALKIHNVTNGSQYPDRWFVYTVGTTFASGFSQYALGGSIVNAWSYYANDSLLARVIADGNFGSSTDDFQITALDTIAKSGSTGSVYLDALRLEGRQTGGFTDSVPAWTSNGAGVVSNSDTPDGSALSVQVPSAALAGSPDCSGSPCFSNENLLEFPYASWAWRKVGGGAAAVVYHLKNARTAATADITYYAGPAAPAGFSWRADGLIASRSWTAGGGQATFAYDGAKRLTGITEGSLTEDQTYDRAGNVTAESRSLTGVSGDAGGGSQSFRYDALDRVTSTDGLSASANRSFTYDRDGNRRSKTEGTTTFSYEVDRTDELIAVTKGVLTRQTFAYDARGNLTTDVEDGLNTVAYAYDLGNKLTAIDAPGTANDATFAFDALGRFRTRVAGGAATDTYSYAGTTEIVSRIANSLSGSTDSIVSPTGDRLGVKVGTTVNWFLPDLHGDIAASLDAAQTTVTNAIRYDAYGETLATASASGAPAPVGERAWKFQGRLDVSPDGLATPLYDMSARLYTPGLGAFTQADTVIGSAQDPLSMNRFLYAQANPWTLTDPTGHCATSYASGGSDLSGWIDDCLAVAGFVWGTGESVVGVGADLAGAAWSVPGYVADVGRCAADEGCRRQTIHDTLMTGAQFAGEIHARGQAVLADPEPAVRRTISTAAFAAAGWVGEEHRKLTATGGFEGGREAGHIFGTVEAVGLTTVAGGELAGAGRGTLATVRGALSETSGSLRSALSGASSTVRGALAQAENRIITPRLQQLTTRAAYDVDQAISRGDFDRLIRLRKVVSR